VNIFSSIIAWLTDPENWTGGPNVNTAPIPQLVGAHLEYALLAVLIAAVIAIPLGAFIGHTGKGGFLVAGVANGLRALPELGLVILFSQLIGIGVFPVVLALTILGIPALLAGTYAGVRNVDSSVVDAARGMGMRGLTVLLRVELPNAMPLIFGGLRTAMLQVIATTTIASYVGLQSLGSDVFAGESAQRFDIMGGAAVLIAALALIMEGLLMVIQRFVVSSGLRSSGGHRRVSRRKLVQAAIAASEGRS
jgi:osmoprotectant transport system permease protein